jgi:DNA-binding winged helix-turn-helix (wHTH) protein
MTLHWSLSHADSSHPRSSPVHTDLARLARMLARDPAPPQPGRGSEIRFRSYRLLPGARILLRGSTRVELGGRAFDLLAALVERRGQVVSKEELLQRVWPNTFVEQSNLRFQMALLRRALGADGELIRTVPRRGYIFAEELEPEADAAPFGEGANPQVPAGAAAPCDEKVLLTRMLHLLIDELVRRGGEPPRLAELFQAGPATA